MAIGLLAGLLFGAATPASKVLLSFTNSFQLAGFLYLGAAVLVLPNMVIQGKQEFALMRDRRVRWSLIGIIVYGGVVGPVFLLLGLRSAASSSVSVWLNMELAATAVLGALFFKDHLDNRPRVAILCVLIAGIAMSIQEGYSGLLSAIFVSLACICWGMDNQLTATIENIFPQTVTFIKGLCGGTTNVLLGYAIGGTHVQFTILLAALLVGAISYGISIILYISAARELGATRAQILFSTSPFWGMLMAYFFLGDEISVYAVVAIIFLAFSIALVSKTSHEHAHVHPALTHTHLHRHDDGHHEHDHVLMLGVAEKHSHTHIHTELRHTHRHYPDVHHRHDHTP